MAGTASSIGHRGVRRATCWLLVAAALGAPPPAAQQPTRNRQRESQIEQQLRDNAPAALPAFVAATAAMDNNDHAEAARLFQQVLEQAPRFSPAVRRLGLSLIASGQRDAGMRFLESALQIERSPENLVSLADALFFQAGPSGPSQPQAQQALALAKEAEAQRRSSDDPSYLGTLAQIALFLGREAEIRDSQRAMAARFPEEPLTHFLNAIVAANDGDFIRSETEIREAERRGLNPEIAARFLGSGVHRRAQLQRALYVLGYATGAWLLGLLCLYLAGKVFSKRVLRSIDTGEPLADARPAELSLRQQYRRLIAVAASYYYVSLPFVVIGVAATTCLVIYFFMRIGWLPVGLLWALAAGALVTIYRTVQTLFIRIGEAAPGRPLERAEAPALWRLTNVVAEKMATRPIEEIRITPGTDMAVFERGSRRERREDRAQRVLLLGAGLLEGFRQAPFAAVLAHEYGHFTHRDTAGGELAMRVNQDMTKLAVALINAGQAGWWNVAFHFLRAYAFLFRRISYGATRLQEVLADRMAAKQYGAANFEEGLRHVVARHIEFAAALRQEVEAAIEERRAVRNLYESQRTAIGVQPEIDEALHRPSTEDDTHPGPMERFRLLTGIEAAVQEVPEGEVRQLFENFDRIANEMTSDIDRRVQAMGTPSPLSVPA